MIKELYIGTVVKNIWNWNYQQNGQNSSSDITMHLYCVADPGLSRSKAAQLTELTSYEQL